MTLMKWNLVDHLSSSTARAFSPPLGEALNPDSPPSSWDLERVQVDRADGKWTEDIALHITVNPPAGGFVDQNGLAHVRIRLHSMGAGLLRFRPAAGGKGPSLELKFGLFLAAASNAYAPDLKMPAWWDRWLEAGCIPSTVIYENVDQSDLAVMLAAVVAPVDSTFANRVAPTLGLSFPYGVVESTKGQFITQFLTGAPDHFMIAEAGAVIGRVQQVGSGGAAPKLILHARYQDDTSAKPSPMSPLELLYLLFGDDSAEAQTHPFLQQITNTSAFLQNTNETPAAWMAMRPPLRTFQRIVWETNLERAHTAGGTPWGVAGSLGPARFVNKSIKFGRHFYNGTYAGSWKCNLYVCDFAIRAGFRVPVHPVGSSRYHYLDPNMLTNLVHDTPGTSSRIPMFGMTLEVGWPQNQQDANLRWGWKLQNFPVQGTKKIINDMILTEGRCLILSMAAPRILKPESVMRAAWCTASALSNQSGHMIIVTGVHQEPTYRSIGRGLQLFSGQYLGAGEHDIHRYDFTYSCRLNTSTNNCVRLHLFELHPGKDPDTIQGQTDLNIAAWANGMPDTTEFSAADEVIVNDDWGNTISNPNQCCRDFGKATSAAPNPRLAPWP